MEHKTKNILKKLELLLISIFISWFVLPIFQYHFSGTIANITMMIILIFWFIINFLTTKRNSKIPKYLIFIFINIGFYILNFFIRPDSGNLHEYIKLGIMFWFSAIIFYTYYKNNDYTSIKYLFKLCTFLIIMTLIPTLLEVLKDPNSIRELTYAGADTLADKLKLQKNIGSYAFIYSLLFIFPIYFYSYKYNKKKKILNLMITLSVGLLIIRASFMICILLFAIILLYCIIVNGNFKRVTKIMIFLLGILTMLLIVAFPSAIENLGYMIENQTIKQRVLEIATLLNDSEEVGGDLGSRFVLYTRSLKTFSEKPLFGIGGYYYVQGINIGYHAQIFDDMARYGIFHLINTIMLLLYYMKFLLYLLKKNTKEKGIIVITLLIYTILLFLNPVYECPWISVIVFLLLPCYATIVKKEADSK